MSALAELLSNPLAKTAAWTLLHFLWEGLLIGLLAWGALALMQRRSPEARYGVGLLFLGAMALAPVVTFLVLLPSAAAPAALAVEGTTKVEPLSWIASLKQSLDASLPSVLAVWCVGVALLSARFVGSLLYLQRLTSVGVEPAPAEWHLVLARISREMGLRRAVRLLRSFRVETPMVVGWMRPVILIPAAAFTGLSPAQVEAVLAHEMAHIRRLDFLVNLVQSVMETLLFFHPALWWLSSRLRSERELCCDDTAVALCGDRTAYARALATLEGLREHAPADLRIGANGGSLMNRIRRLLQPQLAPNPRFRSAALALTAAGLLAGTVAQQPKTPAPEASKQARHFHINGDVVMNPDGTELIKVGKSGSCSLETTVGGITRSYVAKGEGKPIYKVNGVETPMDDAGRAWLKQTVKQVKADETGGRERHARRTELDAHRAELDADRADMDQKRVEMEIERTEMPEVTTEDKDGKRHIIVRKEGKVISDDEMPDPPEVSVTEDGPGERHIIIKKDGKVVEDRVIEMPEITTDKKNGKMHIVVKKDGKVTEDRVVELPKEGGPGEHRRIFQFKGAAGPEEIQRLQDQIRELQQQLEDMRRQLKLGPPPPPPPAPPAPEAPPAPPAPPAAPAPEK